MACGLIPLQIEINLSDFNAGNLFCNTNSLGHEGGGEVVGHVSVAGRDLLHLGLRRVELRGLDVLVTLEHGALVKGAALEEVVDHVSANREGSGPYANVTAVSIIACSSQVSMLHHLLRVVVHIFTEGGALLGALGAVARLGGDEGILVAVVREAGAHHQEKGEDELRGEGGDTGTSHPDNSKSQVTTIKRGNNHIIEKLR